MKIILLANTDWYLFNFRVPLAAALRERGDSVLLLSPPGEYAEKLTSLGFNWQEIQLDRSGVNLFAEALSLLRLWKFYRYEKPDLVHHFTIKPVLYGSIAALLVGVPVVINSVTGLGYVFMRSSAALRSFVSFLYRLVLRQTWTIFENPDDRSVFVDQKLADPKRITLIRGAGVDTKHFVSMPEPQGTPVVMLPARLLWDKGVGEFVEAARILKERGVTAQFVLAGNIDPGNPSAVPLQLLDEWKMQNLVEWWGWQENMIETYRRSTLVCLPSYREGVPTSLIEAAACGRAIVTTDVPGCREIVRQDENGLLVPVRDAIGLADALQRLLENPSLRQKMAKNGRRIAVDEFDIMRVVRSTVDYYDHAQSSLRGQHVR
jgi:glycosyltransferase involved in cell wall biosynthesis